MICLRIQIFRLEIMTYIAMDMIMLSHPHAYFSFNISTTSSNLLAFANAALNAFQADISSTILQYKEDHALYIHIHILRRYKGNGKNVHACSVCIQFILHNDHNLTIGLPLPPQSRLHEWQQWKKSFDEPYLKWKWNCTHHIYSPLVMR